MVVRRKTAIPTPLPMFITIKPTEEAAIELQNAMNK